MATEKLGLTWEYEPGTGRIGLTLPLPEADAKQPRVGYSHSKDFTTVTAGGEVYTFTPKQRAIVSALFRAADDGTPFLSGSALLEIAESEGASLANLFRNSKAWGTLIRLGTLSGGPLGTYRLAEPGELNPPSA